MTGLIFFQHPIGLWGAEPYSTLRLELGPLGVGIYWDVFEQIRLGRGVDSLDHLLTLYDNVRVRRQREFLQAKLRLVLSPKYNLFFVNQQRMVSIVDHTKAIKAQNKALLDGPGLFDDLEY